MSKNKNDDNNNKGSVAIEFALIAPLLFLLIFGILEFGLTVFADSSLQYSLRMAARECMVKSCSENEFRSILKSRMGGLYKESPDLKISVRTVPYIVSAVPRAPENGGNLYLHKDIATLFANPYVLFSNKGSFPALEAQSTKVMVYGAEYKWGGFTGLMSAFIPEKLYAITIVRNEF